MINFEALCGTREHDTVGEQYNTVHGFAILHTALWWLKQNIYRQVSNIRRTLVGNKIVDHSDVVGASPIGAAPTTSSFST